MNPRASIRRLMITVGLVAVVLGGGIVLLGMQAGPGDAPYRFNAEGQLIRPEAYREWIYVGTPLTPNDMNRGNAPFPEFHSVYIDPVSFDLWKRTGKFREGTILMKELISVGSKPLSTTLTPRRNESSRSSCAVIMVLLMGQSACHCPGCR